MRKSEKSINEITGGETKDREKRESTNFASRVHATKPLAKLNIQTICRYQQQYQTTHTLSHTHIHPHTQSLTHTVTYTANEK